MVTRAAGKWSRQAKGKVGLLVVWDWKQGSSEQ